jgi:hypothetical protein
MDPASGAAGRTDVGGLPLLRSSDAHFDRLIRIADRLGQVQAGSPAADQAIHQALDRGGPVLAYTTAEEAAQSLLPAGFELLPAIFGGGAVYAACRHIGMDGELPHPHHGQWGTTLPLAICGACLRAYAALDQDRGSAG